jgi:hypothetical protein
VLVKVAQAAPPQILAVQLMLIKVNRAAIQDLETSLLSAVVVAMPASMWDQH